MTKAEPMHTSGFEDFSPLISIEDSRVCAFRDFHDGIMGEDLVKAAQTTLERIEFLQLSPLPGEKCRGWRAFILQLHQIAGSEPPPNSGAPGGQIFQFEEEAA